MKDYHKMTKAERITLVREAGYMTQTEFAKHIGFSTAAVSHWACNDSQPTLNTLNKIAISTKQSIKWLKTGKGTFNLHWVKEVTEPENPKTETEAEATPKENTTTSLRYEPHLNIPENVYTILYTLTTAVCEERQTTEINNKATARDNMEFFFTQQLKRAFDLGKLANENKS